MQVKLQLSGTQVTVEVMCASLEQVGATLARQRCLIGRLFEENGIGVDPPVSILVPVSRIAFILEC